MNKKGLCGRTLTIDKNKRTAIIYSIDELLYYMVEIHYQDNSYFVGKNDLPDKYGNMEDAITACHNNHVEEAYLALSKTYEETDLATDQRESGRFDYMPVKL